VVGAKLKNALDLSMNLYDSNQGLNESMMSVTGQNNSQMLSQSHKPNTAFLNQISGSGMVNGGQYDGVYDQQHFVVSGSGKINNQFEILGLGANK